MKNITTTEILKALEEATRKADTPEGALTIREMMEAMGWGSALTRRHLLEVKKSGRLEVLRVARENLAGIMQPTIAYRIRPKAKKAG